MTDDVATWLTSLGLEKYLDRFVEHEVTADVLPHLTEADVDALGLPIGPRRRLMVALRDLTASADTHTATAAATRTSAQSGASAERRQITVLFCDLVGSTELATRLDAEELREVMQRYRRACTDVVARYDGHVAQYLGDGLLIYFGWPLAHEDDAERAVRSGLDIVQAVRGVRTAEKLAVRVGLATGPVVVGRSAVDGNAEAQLAIGETPNLAARLQSMAGANQIVIGASTRRLVGDAFELKDLGMRAVKGVAEPQQVWRVESLRRSTGRFEAVQAGRAMTPFVGRDEELAQLLRRWQQACDGDGQVVTIGGEAGLGKSRLARAVRDAVAGHRHAMVRYQCSPYHLNSALYPFLEQVEFAAAITREDTPDQRFTKIAAMVARDGADVASVAPLLAALLGLPTGQYVLPAESPQKRKERTLAAFIETIAARARREPLLLVFEDVHWIDPTSQELLDALVAQAHSLPVLLVATHRPEYTPAFAGRVGVTSITLSRLGRRQSMQLVERVTAGRRLPPEVQAQILAHADGVPLFVEELTRSVIESGLVRDAGDRYAVETPALALAIPTSLRDSLAARLDRLGRVKELAQIGACIGREFSYDLLAEMSPLPPGELDAGLAALVEAGLMSARGRPPSAVYTFKHALVQDAAYDSLLKGHRAQVHASVAEAVERRFPDRVESQPEWLAHHQTQAGNVGAAIPLWRRAGALAMGRVALREAVAHLSQGLALVPQLPESAERDNIELSVREQLNAAISGLRGWAAPDINDNAAAILRLARTQQNAQSLLLGLWWMWTSTITQGRIADAVPWAEQLLEEGTAADDLDMRIFGHAACMVSAFLGGRFVDAQAEADRALALYDPHRAERWVQLTGYDLKTFVDVYACQMLWMLGYPDRARQLSESSRAHAESVGHAFNRVWAVVFGAYVYAYTREPERLMALTGEAERLAREQGIAFIQTVSVPQARGVATLEAGGDAEAVTLLRRGIEAWTHHGGNVRVPYLKSRLAEGLARLGDLDAALDLVEQCVAQIERPAWQEREWLAEVLRVKGTILARLGRGEAAEATLRGAVDCARAQQARGWELRASTSLARLMAETGRRDEAATLLGGMTGWFTEGADTPDVLDARALLLELTRHMEG